MQQLGLLQPWQGLPKQLVNHITWTKHLLII